MKMRFSSLSFLTAITGLMLVTACKKESSQQTAGNLSDTEVQSISQESADAETESNDVNEIGFSAGADLQTAIQTNAGEIPGGAAGTGTGLGIRIDLMADLQWKIGPGTLIEVTPDDSTFPKTVTINYGDGVICRDGKLRKGTVVLNFSAPLRQPGSVLTITLKDYYVNRKHLEGTRSIVNLSANGILAYSVKVEDGAITWPNGRGFKFSAEKTITQTAGMGTVSVRDDVFSIEGKTEIIYNNGITVTRNTESPLIKPVACAWITQGVLKITIQARVYYIDFGNGEFDNKATLKWASGEKEITLP